MRDSFGYSIQAGGSEGADLDFLREMLLEAFYWESGIRSSLRAQWLQDPEFQKWTASWSRFGDRLIVAEHDGERVGAGWYRLWTEETHSYGFVDVETPELGLGVAREHRGRGVGTALMKELILAARVDRFSGLSLSVDPRNPARRIYESLGFRRVGASGTSWTYRLRIDSEPPDGLDASNRVG